MLGEGLGDSQNRLMGEVSDNTNAWDQMVAEIERAQQELEQQQELEVAEVGTVTEIEPVTETWAAEVVDSQGDVLIDTVAKAEDVVVAEEMEENGVEAEAGEIEVEAEVAAGAEMSSEEREEKVRRIFEQGRERIGFRKIVDKVMGKIVGAMDWLRGENEGEKITSLRELKTARAEVERRMMESQEAGDEVAVQDWAQRVAKLDAKMIEMEVGEMAA